MQKPEDNIKKQSIFIIALIVLGLMLLSFLLYYGGFEVVTTLFKNNDKTTEIEHNEPAEVSVIAENTKNSAPLSFANSLVSYVNSFKLPSSASSVEQNSDIEHDINDYSNYLMQVNLLISNFLQDKNYNKQLKIIEKISLPKEIKNILKDFDNYNTSYLMSEREASGIEIIFPRDCPRLQKFIKVTKKFPSSLHKEKHRADIISKLEYLINFFYSEKFSKELLKYTQMISRIGAENKQRAPQPSNLGEEWSLRDFVMPIRESRRV